MIAFHGYPSSIVEDEFFRNFVHGLNPEFQMPSRAAVEGICHRFAEDEMIQLKETLARCSGLISLATGVAETGQGRALYMVCQFIDDEWGFQKRIMQVFKVVNVPTYNHSALLGAEEVNLNVPERIQRQLLLQPTSSKLEDAVRRWGLRGQLFAVAWGKELEACLEEKDFIHGSSWSVIQGIGEQSIDLPEVTCVTYTSDVLDLLGETFLEALSIRYEEDILKAVKDLHLSHEERTKVFSELGLNHVGTYKKRWYTYYCALEVFHKECPDSSEALQEEQPMLKPNQLLEIFSRMTPAEIGDKITTMLKPKPSRLKKSIFTDLLRRIFGAIYRALETISSPSSPTANICIGELMKLRAVLQSEAKNAVAYAGFGGFLGDGKNADVVLGEVQDVLDNHLKEVYLYLSMPAIVDPRFKLEYIATVLDEVCGSEARSFVSRVEQRIENIFGEHRGKLRRIVDGEGTSRMAAGTGTAAMDDGNSTESITDELEHRYLTDGLVPHEEDSITELERYLTDGRVPCEEGEGFDVLMWWKANSSRYPTVASMARDALAMPVSDMMSPEHIARIRSMFSSYCLTYPQAQ